MIRDPFGSRPPRRGPLPWLVAVAVALGGVLVVLALTHRGPFARNSAPVSAAAPTASPTHVIGRRVPPLGVWIAIGTTTTTSGGPVSSSEVVRAWDVRRVCARAGCRLEIARELDPASPIESDEAPLLLRPQTQVSGFDGAWHLLLDYTASFPVHAVSCGGRTVNARDTLELQWVPSARRLTALVPAPGGCSGAIQIWSAEPAPSPVPPPPNPGIAVPVAPTARYTLRANPSHAASASTFRAAARRICGHVNASLAPIVARLRRDGQILSASPTGRASARAGADVAAALRLLLPLALVSYRTIPQPPAGPLDALWLRDVEINRSEIVPSGLFIGSLVDALLARAAYATLLDPLDAQTAAADSWVAAATETGLRGHDAESTRIERRMGLPASCVNPPAFGASGVSLS